MAKKGQPPSNRLPKGEAAFRALLYSYKQNARNRKLVFELSEEKFRELTSCGCYYCGNPPSNIKKPSAYYALGVDTGSYIYNGIDRVDNTKGYIEDNCVSCCLTCNYMKQETAQEEFLKDVERIYNFRIKKA